MFKIINKKQTQKILDKNEARFHKTGKFRLWETRRNILEINELIIVRMNSRSRKKNQCWIVR